MRRNLWGNAGNSPVTPTPLKCQTADRGSLRSGRSLTMNKGQITGPWIVKATDVAPTTFDFLNLPFVFFGRESQLIHFTASSCRILTTWEMITCGLRKKRRIIEGLCHSYHFYINLTYCQDPSLPKHALPQQLTQQDMRSLNFKFLLQISCTFHLHLRIFVLVSVQYLQLCWRFDVQARVFVYCLWVRMAILYMSKAWNSRRTLERRNTYSRTVVSRLGKLSINVK